MQKLKEIFSPHYYVLLFFRNDGLWYFGKSHLTRNKRQIYLKNMVNPEKKSICANELESNFWFKTKDNSSFPILVSCDNQEQILTWIKNEAKNKTQWRNYVVKVRSLKWLLGLSSVEMRKLKWKKQRLHFLIFVIFIALPFFFYFFCGNQYSFFLFFLAHPFTFNVF